MFDQQDFQPLANDTQKTSEPLRESLRESFHELRELSPIDDFEKKPKSSSELAAHFSCTKEAIQDWFKIISQAYCWLPLSDLKSGVGKNTRYSSFCIQQMSNLKSSRETGLIANDWIAFIHQENAEEIAVWKASQLPQLQSQQQPEQTITPPQVTGGLMNLPSLSPVTSIVPQGENVSTDNNPAKDLAIRSNALSEGLEQIENLKNFLKGASAVADSYIENLEKTTEEEERQAKEIEELAFELEVKADYIKRAEVRKSVINKESSKTRTAAESKVADFASFFVKRSNRNASS
jgi:hypothetical protein